MTVGVRSYTVHRGRLMSGASPLGRFSGLHLPRRTRKNDAFGASRSGTGETAARARVPLVCDRHGRERIDYAARARFYEAARPNRLR